MTAASKILMVEDDEKLLVLGRRALEKEGFVVLAARSGAALMNALVHERPDLVVLDVGLPDMDGLDLLRALKKDPRTRAIPVLVWSGRRADADRLLALKLGAGVSVRRAHVFCSEPSESSSCRTALARRAEARSRRCWP